MAEFIPIQVPFANPNDTAAILVEWLAVHGGSVTLGQIVARMETTKTVIDVDSPATGRLDCVAEAGAEVPLGMAIGFIEVSAGAASSPTQPRSVARYAGFDTVADDTLTSKGPPGSRAVAHRVQSAYGDTDIRLSRRAQLVASHIGMDPTTLGLVGLVKTREFLEAVARASVPTEMTNEQITD